MTSAVSAALPGEALAPHLHDLSAGDARATHYLERVSRMNQAYAGLDRPGTDPSEILAHKYAVGLWRMRALERIAEALSEADAADRATLVEALIALRVRPPQPLLRALLSAIDDADLRARLMAAQGLHADGAGSSSRAAGPGVDLKITANRDSRWPFEKWREIAAFSEYQQEAGGVRYRGVHFLPGDILLANVNLDGNGLYTALADPRGFCSHAAVFAMLEHAGRRFPAVMETYEKGVRAVPLSVFLGPRFSSYVEVYRHAAVDPQRHERINRAAVQTVFAVKGYNFDTEDPDRDYLSCTSVGRHLLQAAEVGPIATRSAIAHPRIRSNLERLGYAFFRFFAPVDYLLDPDVRCTGWVDNHQWDRMLARELVESHFRSLFERHDLVPERFPFMYRLNRWGLSHMRRRTPVGRLVSRLEGFDHVTLPKGPDDIIAVILLVEGQLARAIRKLRPRVREYLRDLDALDLSAALADETLVRAVARGLRLPWLR